MFYQALSISIDKSYKINKMIKDNKYLKTKECGLQNNITMPPPYT